MEGLGSAWPRMDPRHEASYELFLSAAKSIIACARTCVAWHDAWGHTGTSELRSRRVRAAAVCRRRQLRLNGHVDAPSVGRPTPRKGTHKDFIRLCKLQPFSPLSR